MDLTGCFPKKSLRGYEYILFGYHYDANYIRGIPIKNRYSTIIKEVWEKLHDEFKKAGVDPQTYILHNEKSKDLLESLNEQK